MTTADVARERPILFSGPMVRAILEGRKTQTRRVINQRVYIEFDSPDDGHMEQSDPRFGAEFMNLGCSPFGYPGDRLWVRETWCPSPDGPIYRATEWEHGIAQPDDAPTWKPSIHMPRWASRLSLEITEVRVERVREINATDAVAEGTPRCEHGYDYCTACGGDPVTRFQTTVWDPLNAERGYGWRVNPWVWVIGFKIVNTTNTHRNND